MARPSIRTLTTALGWIIFRISIKAAFTNVTTRVTFRPPPVDPAQAPQNMRMTSSTRENSGHRLKSTLEKPVVEMMEET